MNVVLWARVSSREQREGYSIDAQLRVNRERAQANGWHIAREFVVAESAKRGAERKVFNEMFAWVKANAKREKIKTILSHKLDRVCRNMRDAVRLQELEDTCGVQLAFVDNQFGPGAAGALSFNVMAAVAQYYSDNLRSEVLKGMDEKVRQGWPTGLAPYGYVNVEDRDEPVQPHPERARTIIRIFELYATGSHTFKSLADQLEREGHVFRSSHPRFNRTALSWILNNRFYIGELHRNGQVFEGRYKRLIDRGTFDACQDVMNGRNRRTGTPEHPFAGGLFQCAFCGQSVTGERIRRKLKSGGVREHLYYRCANNHPGHDHPTVRWKSEDLEQADRGRSGQDAPGDSGGCRVVPHRVVRSGYRPHDPPAAAGHVAGQTEERVGDDARPPSQCLSRGHDRRDRLQGQVERTQSAGGHDGRGVGPIGRRGPGSR